MKRIVLLITLLILTLAATAIYAEDNSIVNHKIINISEEGLNIRVIYPYLKEIKGANNINRNIKDLVDRYLEEAKSSSNPQVDLSINYSYTNYKDILSIQLDSHIYTGGPHGINDITSFTLNPKTGDLYKVEDLFIDERKALDLITNLIIKSIEKNPNDYFDNAKEKVLDKNNDYQFYIDDKNIIVYFDLYDISPYSSGIRKINLELKYIKDLLKENIYHQIKSGNEGGTLSLNGLSINSNDKLYKDIDGTILLPLRIIAEALNYKVDWNMKDGAIVNKEPIKNQLRFFDSIIIDKGVTYVPIQYFTNILNEHVYFSTNYDDRLIIKIYTK